MWPLHITRHHPPQSRPIITFFVKFIETYANKLTYACMIKLRFTVHLWKHSRYSKRSHELAIHILQGYYWGGGGGGGSTGGGGQRGNCPSNFQTLYIHNHTFTHPWMFTQCRQNYQSLIILVGAVKKVGMAREKLFLPPQLQVPSSPLY